MEDGVRFLVMAGGILVGILILTLGLYLFATSGAGATNVQNQIASDQMEKFNAPYTTYLGKENITIYDIVNLAKKAKEYNKSTSDSQPIEVKYYNSKNDYENNRNVKNLTNESDEYLLDEIIIKERDHVYEATTRPVPGETPELIYLPKYVCPESGIDYYEDDGKVRTNKFYKKEI